VALPGATLLAVSLRADEETSERSVATRPGLLGLAGGPGRALARRAEPIADDPGAGRPLAGGGALWLV